MEFRVLGPLEVVDAGGALSLGGAQQRLVLALLLVGAPEPLSRDRLIDELWGERPPATAEHAVQVYVSGIRKLLRGSGGNVSVRTSRSGYAIDIEPAQLDARRFEDRLHEAHRTLAEDPAHARRLFEGALGLWRGRPLAEFERSDLVHREAERLEELHALAVEGVVEARLACGEHREATGQITGLVAADPLRERPRRLLMLALYRSGRHAEALAAYRDARAALDEIGLQPSPELRRLEADILRHDPSLQIPGTATGELLELSTADPDCLVLDGPRSADALPPGEGPPAQNQAILLQDPALAAPKGRVPGRKDLQEALAQPPIPGFAPRANDGAFVGREACLDQLRSRWDATCACRTSLILLMGEAGIGKTRLAARFAEEVHQNGGIVLYGRADAEALLPCEPFAEALDHLINHAGAEFAEELRFELSILSRPFPRLRRRADSAEALVDRRTLRYQMFEAAVSVITRASAMRPLLLVLDDLQWADRLTLLLLRHVLRHAEGAPLLVLGTFRDVEVPRDHPLNDLMSNLRRERHYDQLRLAGLDETSTGALVADRLGIDSTRRFVQRLQQQTHGNPFFIEETLRALADAAMFNHSLVDEDALRKLGVPDAVADVILRRVRPPALSRLASELLTAASVIGSSFRLEIVEQLVDAPTRTVIAAMEEGISARLILEVPDDLGTFAFSHALVREVLYGQLTSAHRVRLHHGVAQALERLSERERVNPAELAYHFRLARPVASSRLARRYSIEAGKRAADVFAYEEAIQHFRRALELFDDNDEEHESDRCDVLLALGRVQWHAGDDGARDTFLAAAESAERRGAADQLARAALGLGERYFEVTYLGTRYTDLLDKALTAVAPTDSPRRALLLARKAVNLGYPTEDDGAHALAEDAVAMARRIGDETLLAAVLTARHITLLDIRHIEQRLQIGEELSSLSESHQELAAERHHWRTYDLLGVGDLQAARDEHVQLATLAANLGQPLFRALANGYRGLWAELEGDIELADRCAEELLQQARLAHMRDALSSWAVQVWARRRRQGRVSELAPVVEEIVSSGGGPVGWTSALGVLRFEMGDVRRARAIYEEELCAGVRGVPRGMFWLSRLVLLSELSWMLDDASRAEELYAALVPYAARIVVVSYCSVWGPVAGYLGLLAKAFGESKLAARHFSDALARAREMQAPLLIQDLQIRRERMRRPSAR